MGQRLNLQTLLEETIKPFLKTTDDPRKHVFFQPPETVKLSYPCIIYSLSRINPIYADNQPYAFYRPYSVMAITRDPESGIEEALARLPKCRSDRFYTADNLYHYSFTLNY